MITKRILLSDPQMIDKASAEGAPRWNRVAIPGKFYRHDFGPAGSMTFDRAAFEQMISNWKRMGGNALPVDRHHWGESNDTRIRAEDKGAVGWMEDLRIDAEGNLEALINWNDDGREDITKDRRRYFSPSVLPQSIDRRTGKPQGWTIYGGGLLNDPFLTELPRMAASAEQPTASGPTTEHQKMPVHLLAALALIGLTESSTEADVTAAQAKLEADRVKLAAEKDEAIKLASTHGAGVEALKVSLAAEKTERIALTAKVADLEKNATDAALNHAIDRAADKLFHAGKLSGAKTEMFKKLALGMGLAFAVEDYESRPAVPLAERGHNEAEKPAATDLKALQAKYDGELDALIKAGEPSAVAAKKLSANKSFLPLFTTLTAN